MSTDSKGKGRGNQRVRVTRGSPNLYRNLSVLIWFFL
jgi:hypothetical protein